MGARTTALSALIACRKQGAWADGTLKEYIRRDGLDRRDAALATRLCYGVLQNRMLLDHYIQCCLTGPIKKLQPIVLDILRLGAYQLLLTDRIPGSAAVNEAVEQGKKYANQRAAGLINAILRAMIRKRDVLPVPDSLSVRYSHPEALVKLLEKNIPAGSIEALLESHNAPVDTVVHVNTLCASDHDVINELQAHGVCVTEHPWMPHALHLSGFGNIEQLPAYKEGRIQVQDSAARLAVLAADVKPGMNVLDVCAAPGGKSFAAAMLMNNTGSVISCDIHPHKIDLIAKGAERLGIDIISPKLQDGSSFNVPWQDLMDVVIADVPCSGLGVIRKKPDIRYKDLEPMKELPKLQKRILDNAARYVKPGGVLIYSTCTILKRENEEVVDAFLAEHSNYTLEALTLPSQFPKPERDGMVTLLPSIHATDGFFICKLRRLS